MLALATSLPSAFAPSALAVDEGPGPPPPPGAAEGAGGLPIATLDPDRESPVPESVARTNRVIVRWQPGVAALAAAPAQVAALRRASRRSVAFVRETPTGGAIYDLGEELGGSAAALLRRLGRVPGVASVEPDRWLTVDAPVPNDPRAGELWGLLDAAASPHGIDALTAWDASQGTGVVVAVVDTGIVSHPELVGQVLPGYDFVSYTFVSNDGNGRDANPADPGDHCNGAASTWHGTHVAGTIAALADNGVGVFGGAPLAKIVPVRALGTCGGYETDIADGIRWAAGGSVTGVPANTNPADVINLSVGALSAGCTEEFEAAIAAARGSGALVVASAGNNNWHARYIMPANCAGVLTVGATDVAGVRGSFSNFGPELELSAPGVNVLSTVDSGTTGPVGPDYHAYDGTSMAAPHVSAAAALLAGHAPAVTGIGLSAVLVGTTTPMSGDGYCDLYGCGTGIANAADAIAALQVPAPFVARPEPAATHALPGQKLRIDSVAVDVDGVAAGQLSVDGGSWLSMSAVGGTSFGGQTVALGRTITTPATEGPHEVCVRARDSLDTTSEGGSCATFVVDQSPPALTTPSAAPAAAAVGVPVEISADAVDELSPMGAVEASLDSGPWMPMPPRDSWDGNEFTPTEHHATVVGGMADEVSGGNWGTCTLNHASVACWGMNYAGQLGDGTYEPRGWPAVVGGLAEVSQVSAGSYHTCVLEADTTVSCWGWNQFGEVGNGTASGPFPAKGVATPVKVAGLSGVSHVSAGGFHTCTLMGDATVRCWGYNAFGQLGDGSQTDRTSPVAVAGLTDVVAVSASETGGEEIWPTHTCALRADRTVWCWGDNRYGQLGDGTLTTRTTPVKVAGLSDVVAVHAGGAFNCALLEAGTVQCWGFNLVGEIGDGTTTDRATPVAVKNLSGIVAIDADFGHACALHGDGRVSCWGWNGGGQLGEAIWDNSAVPIEIVGIGDAVAISTGSAHNCALTSTGATRCWGENWYYQLGLGDDLPLYALRPGDVLGLAGRVAPGVHGFCARASDSLGNVSASECASFEATPETVRPEVRTFRALSPSSGGGSIRVSLALTEPVTGLSTSDFVLGGTATGWSIGGVTGSGAGPYVVTLLGGTSRTGGTVTLGLSGRSVRDLAGNIGPWSAHAGVTIHTILAGPPTVYLKTGATGPTVPAKVAWPAASGSGAIVRYELQQKKNDGAWATVTLSSATARSASLSLVPGNRYRYRVRATDAAGIVSKWSAPPELLLSRFQETHSTGSYTGAVGRGARRGASGGYVRHASSAGRVARLTFDGGSVAWVTTRSPSRGKAAIYLDGVLLRTIELYAATTSTAQAVFAKTVPHGRHVLEIRLTGARNSASSSSRVDIDAFVVRR